MDLNIPREMLTQAITPDPREEKIADPQTARVLRMNGHRLQLIAVRNSLRELDSDDTMNGVPLSLRQQAELDQCMGSIARAAIHLSRLGRMLESDIAEQRGCMACNALQSVCPDCVCVDCGGTGTVRIVSKGGHMETDGYCPSCTEGGKNG